MDNNAAVQAFVGRLHRAAVEIRAADAATLEKGAQLAKRMMLDAPGAPHFLRGVGRKGVKTTVRYKILGHAASIRWYGPAHLVDRDTARHVITAKGLAGSRASRQNRVKRAGATTFGGFSGKGAKALTLPDGGLRPYVVSRGTHGKHFYETGREAALALLPKVHRDVVHGALRNIYQGD